MRGARALAVAIPAATVVPVIAVVASPAWAAGCGVSAETPIKSTSNVSGQGTRFGCASKVYVKVRLRWDRPWSPDPDIDWLGGQFVNITLAPWGDCLAGTHSYYVDTTADGGQYATSDPRRSLTCS